MLIATLNVAVVMFGLFLFGQAGLSKLARPLVYQTVMQGYLKSYLNRPVSVWMVRAVGVIELDAGVALLFPQTSAMAMAVCAGLLLMYAWLMWRQLAAGQTHLRCGCGGADSDTKVSRELVVRNVLVALPFALLAFDTSGGVALPEIGVGLGLAAILIFSYQAVDGLIANRQRWQGAQV